MEDHSKGPIEGNNELLTETIEEYWGVLIPEPSVQEVNTNLLVACKELLAWLDSIWPPGVFTGESGDPGAVEVARLRKLARDAIAASEES